MPMAEMAGTPHRRPTVYDVATDAGVSAMSVSRVLNGNGNVSSQMRRRVMRSVAKLGYRRNENARSLRPGQRSGLVGVIITNIENPYYAQVLLGIEDALDASDRRIVVGLSHGDPDRETRLIADFAGRQVEGLVLVPCGADAAETSRALGDLPLVLASRAHPGLDADTVVIDDREGSQRGVAALLEEGYRRIAFLGNDEQVSTSQRRFEGYQQALGAAGIAVETGLVRRTCRDQQSSAEAIRGLLATETVDAVFCANNQVTTGVLPELVAWQRRHPNRALIPVLGVDGFRMSSLVEHPLMLVEHDARALGRSAAELLTNRLGPKVAESAPRVTLTLPTVLRQEHS
ncbi:LacI family transcriptional regulator [Parenemella sanctibonifatiensis]|uniref:LacI family transcriptional regulator n=2 Tax=Parenemella sanctibonifatiensis TaxID=2016505 RepID=A0A255EFK7_9ACTN|nr:LacI family transcriptional regulator [Parenemella sanctibonifatiensis]